MKYRFVGVAAALVAASFVSAPAGPAHAFGPLSGRVVDSLTGVPVAGVQVHLTDTAGSDLPGLTMTTGANGRFSLVPPMEEVGVRFDGSAVHYASGYLGCTAVVSTWGEACTHGPGRLGTVRLQRRWFTGRVVDSVTSRPLAGVVVHVTDVRGVDLVGDAYTAITGPNGKFKVYATGEEHGLRLDGSAIVHESGYVSGLKLVEPTWGAGGTFAPSPLGTIRLDPVPPAPVTGLVLASKSARAVTATFTPPATGGSRTWYELTCGNVTRTYTGSGQTRSGFIPGGVQCAMVARNAAGASQPVWAGVTVRAPRR